MAVFGSSTPAVTDSVASACSALHIPFFTSEPALSNQSPARFTVRMAPSAREVAAAVADAAFALEWTEAAVVAHKSSGKAAYLIYNRGLMG